MLKLPANGATAYTTAIIAEKNRIAEHIETIEYADETTADEQRSLNGSFDPLPVSFSPPHRFFLAL